MVKTKEEEKEYRKIKARESRLRIKKEVFNHYGNDDPKCIKCGQFDLSKLTIDHINDNGVDERKITGLGSNFYAWLRKNHFPDNNYEILCFSCNCSKRINPTVVENKYIYGSLMNRLTINFNIFCKIVT